MDRGKGPSDLSYLVGPTPRGEALGEAGPQAEQRNLEAHVEDPREPFENLGALHSLQSPYQAFVPTRMEDPRKDARQVSRYENARHAAVGLVLPTIPQRGRRPSQRPGLYTIAAASVTPTAPDWTR
jgi:hypothetical protein